jgi:hypothetical protein
LLAARNESQTNVLNLYQLKGKSKDLKKLIEPKKSDITLHKFLHIIPVKLGHFLGNQLKFECKKMQRKFLGLLIEEK